MMDNATLEQEPGFDGDKPATGQPTQLENNGNKPPSSLFSRSNSMLANQPVSSMDHLHQQFPMMDSQIQSTQSPSLGQYQGNAQLYLTSGSCLNEMSRIESIRSYPGSASANPVSLRSTISNWFQHQFGPISALPADIHQNSQSSLTQPQSSLSIFFLNRFYALSTLVGTLLFLVLINIILTIWIVTSLNLHKEGNGLKYFKENYHHRNLPRSHSDDIKFEIDGNLAIDRSLLIESIKGHSAREQQESNEKNQRQHVFDQLDTDINQNYLREFRIESPLSSNSITLQHIDPIDNAENSVTLLDNAIELKTTNLVIKSAKSHSRHNYQHKYSHHHNHRHDPRRASTMSSTFSANRKPTNSRSSLRTEQTSSLIEITPEQLMIDADQFSSNLLKQPSAGLRIEQQLNTGKIGADIRYNLKLESRTESVSLSAGNQIELESMSGDVELTAYEDIVLNSQKGNNSRVDQLGWKSEQEEEERPNWQTIRFDSRTVILSHIVAQQNNRQHSYHHNHHSRHRLNQDQDWSKSDPIAYQLCLCSNGNLFAADVGAICQSDSLVCAAS